MTLFRLSAFKFMCVKNSEHVMISVSLLGCLAMSMTKTLALQF